MTYQIIDTDHDGTRLPAAPVQVWVIASLEISVRQGDANHLLLTYPSYPLNQANSQLTHDEGYWAIPFVAYPVPMSYSAPTTVGSLRALARSIDEQTIVSGVSQLAYQMGLQDTTLEYRGEFFELKNSPRTPEVIKAFKVVRYGLASVALGSVRNLADPDVRQGYVYLPLNDYEAVTRVRHSVPHNRNERWFLGKPLMSDIEYIVGDQRVRSALAASSIDVDAEMFLRRESGLLCAVDLAGYGAALKYALEHMRSFAEEPVAIQSSFRRSVATSFEQMLARLGVMQVQMAGDGFIAALPSRVFADVVDTLHELLAAWRDVVAQVRKLNAAIDDQNFRVGSRMALHFGDYSYGRVGGVRSFVPAFDGAAIIDVARLEQGLATGMASETIAVDPDTVRLPHKGNCVIVSDALERQLGHSWEPTISGYKRLGHFRLIAKEFRSTGLVWEVDSDGV